MQAFLKTRNRPFKQFLGVIGSYLVETLDSDSVVLAILSTTNHKYDPSNQSRFTGASKRMVLKTFSKDAIIILETTKGSDQYNECELSIFINHSNLDTAMLLEEARKLANHRWKVISF